MNITSIRNLRGRLKVLAVGALLLTIASTGYMVHYLYDCSTTGCFSDGDDGQGNKVKAKTLSYATQDCDMSYHADECKHLTVNRAGYNCGLRGFCGWLVEVQNSGPPMYRASATLEASSQQGYNYQVITYSEEDTAYTAKLHAIFLDMCRKYMPTAASGCNELYLSAPIDWLGNRNTDNNTATGVAVSYIDPYEFRAKIDRSGMIIEAQVTNYEQSSDRVLYQYDGTSITH